MRIPSAPGAKKTNNNNNTNITARSDHLSPLLSLSLCSQLMSGGYGLMSNAPQQIIIISIIQDGTDYCLSNETLCVAQSDNLIIRRIMLFQSGASTVQEEGGEAGEREKVVIGANALFRNTTRRAPTIWQTSECRVVCAEFLN